MYKFYLNLICINFFLRKGQKYTKIHMYTKSSHILTTWCYTSYLSKTTVPHDLLFNFPSAASWLGSLSNNHIRLYHRSICCFKRYFYYLINNLVQYLVYSICDQCKTQLPNVIEYIGRFKQ